MYACKVIFEKKKWDEEKIVRQRTSALSLTYGIMGKKLAETAAISSPKNKFEKY